MTDKKIEEKIKDILATTAAVAISNSEGIISDEEYFLKACLEPMQRIRSLIDEAVKAERERIYEDVCRDNDCGKYDLELSVKYNKSLNNYFDKNDYDNLSIEEQADWLSKCNELDKSADEVTHIEEKREYYRKLIFKDQLAEQD